MASLVKRPWTEEEDIALTAAVHKFGACRWSMIATQLSSGRIGKQCRERWSNHLSPQVKKDGWSEDEDHAIMQGVALMGTRWCEIIKTPQLSGRTDNAIKNRFYTLSRKMKAKQQTLADRADQLASEVSSDDSPATPVLTQNERIVAVCRELAFSTDETERDHLIERLTATLHEGALDQSNAAVCEPVDSAPPSDFVVVGGDMHALTAEDAEELCSELVAEESTRQFDATEDASLSTDELLELLSPRATDSITTARQSSYARDAFKLSDNKLQPAKLLPDELCDDAYKSDASTVAADEVANLGEILADDSSSASTISIEEVANRALSPEPSETHETHELSTELREMQYELCDVLELCGSSESEQPAVESCDAKENYEKQKSLSHEDRTAACLGGRHAYKALLAPLSLPQHEDLAEAVYSPKRRYDLAEIVDSSPKRRYDLAEIVDSPKRRCDLVEIVDSPKRMRTPTGASAAPCHFRCPQAHALSSQPQSSPSDAPAFGLSHSPLSARDFRPKLSPLRAVTGTKEPGTVHGAAASPLAPSPRGGSPSSTMTISLASFSNLLADEIDR